MNDEKTNTKGSQIIAIFDFDWSLINTNSDTFIFEQLCPDIVKQMPLLRIKFPVWTDLMDECMRLLYINKSPTKQQIQEAFNKTPIFNEIIELIKFLHNNNAVCYIVSDANTLFIEYILKAYNLDYAFPKERIFTNYAYYESTNTENNNNSAGDRMRIKYFHTNPHSCTRCPRNLCKGEVMESIKKTHNNNTSNVRYIYLGDGTGDFCPITRFSQQDYIAARKDWAFHKLLTNDKHLVSAEVCTWSNGSEILQIYQKFIEHCNNNNKA